MLSKQEPDKAYFVEMGFTHMGIIYKICKLYAAEEDRDDLKREIRINQLYSQISKLKDLDKTIIFLYLEQCSNDEIAEITGISTKNVSVRLVRIREKLRSQLHIQTTEV